MQAQAAAPPKADVAQDHAVDAPPIGGDETPISVEREEATPPQQQAPRPRTPSLAPRVLALTAKERDYAAAVAGTLRTPRTVKKFTNLYRLLRAGIDEPGGDLDRFLSRRGAAGDAPPNAAEYEAVLILLTAIVAFPEQAPDMLLGLGDLRLDAPPDQRTWTSYVEHVMGMGPRYADAAHFLTAVPGVDAGWTREPFQRWALEVSRYSFATGQEVFARSYGAPSRGP